MSDEYSSETERVFDSVCEPMPLWGGSWTEQKLDAFAKYVTAYLTIMHTYRDKYHWKLIYFDGFAGSGSRGDDNSEPVAETGLFNSSEIDIKRTEGDVYVGAAERVLQIGLRGFDYYYFNEPDKESRDALSTKLAKYQSPDKKFAFRSNDANTELVNLAGALHNDSNLKALILLDPFGMQLNWDSIASLKGCGADVWILVPTGVIINRLLDSKGKLLLSNKLQKFFGMSETDIRAFFYEDRQENTLFGEDITCHKLPNAIRRIADLYVNKLSGIFSNVIKEPLVLYNTRNVPIFHFVFASNNKTATKIASEIVGKIQY